MGCSLTLNWNEKNIKNIKAMLLLFPILEIPEDFPPKHPKTQKMLKLMAQICEPDV